MKKSNLVAMNTFLAVCIIMSIGGAVNSGMSYFLMATPFMGYLCWATKSSKKYFTIAIVFVLLCMFVSVTRDSNPLIFPIINDGTITIAKDGYYRAFDDGSGSFTEYDHILINKPNSQQKEILEKFVSEKNEKTVTIPDTDSFAGGVLTLTKLTKGEVYPVTGIYHEGYDLGEYQSVMTSIGSIPSNDIKEGNIIPNKPIQSGWSKTLGYLMVFPLGIIVLFLGILVNLLPA